MSHRRITAPRDSIAARRITGIHIVDLGKTSTRMDMDIDIMEEIEAITRTGTAETTHQEAQSFLKKEVWNPQVLTDARKGWTTTIGKSIEGIRHSVYS